MFKARLIFALVLIGFLFGSVQFVTFAGSKECEIKGQSFDSVEHSFWAGCMVEKDGKWLPLSAVREFN